MPKRSHGDPRMVLVITVRCRHCPRSRQFTYTRALPARLERRFKCDGCGMRCAKVSCTWHKWPDERWLRDLPELEV